MKTRQRGLPTLQAPSLSSLPRQQEDQLLKGHCRAGSTASEALGSPPKSRRSRSRKRAPEDEDDDNDDHQQEDKQQDQQQPQQLVAVHEIPEVFAGGPHHNNNGNGAFLRAWRVWLIASLIWTVSMLAISWGLTVFGQEMIIVGGKLLSHQWDLVVSFWSSLRSGEIKYQCSIGGSLIHMLECELASFANRVILFLVSQTYEFLQIINKSTNLLHILTLVNGIVSAVRALFGSSLPLLMRAFNGVWWSALDWHALLLSKVDEWPGI